MNVKKPVRLARRVLYENPWVNLYVDRVEFPGGRVIEEHHVLHFDRQAVTALVENDRGEILLSEIYRYVTDRVEWETPGGAVDVGEPILEAARREVVEETGYDSVGHREIYTFCPLEGISDMVFHVIRCRATERVGEPDPNEVRRVQWFTRDQIRAMIAANELHNGFAVVALLLWLAE